MALHPCTAIFQNSGGGRGAGGCRIQGPGPAAPPGVEHRQMCSWEGKLPGASPRSRDANGWGGSEPATSLWGHQERAPRLSHSLSPPPSQRVGPNPLIYTRTRPPPTGERARTPGSTNRPTHSALMVLALPWGGARVQPPTFTTPKHLDPLKGGGWEEGGDRIKNQTNANQRQCTPQSGTSHKGWEGGGDEGGSQEGVPGTPTYIPQNDSLIATIILNTHMWGFLKKSGRPGPSSQVGGWGGWMGEFCLCPPPPPPYGLGLRQISSHIIVPCTGHGSCTQINK